MLLFPKKPKFLKSFSGKKGSRITNSKILNLRFGNVAIIANENGKITNFQLEALRRFLKKVFKKKAQLFFRFFPQLAITKKPNDIRQGRGKGNVKYWAFFVKKGDILVEIKTIQSLVFTDFVKNSHIKLPIKTNIFSQTKRWTF